jgi:hypothetical protein
MDRDEAAILRLVATIRKFPRRCDWNQRISPDASGAWWVAIIWHEPERCTVRRLHEIQPVWICAVHPNSSEG